MSEDGDGDGDEAAADDNAAAQIPAPVAAFDAQRIQAQLAGGIPPNTYAQPEEVHPRTDTLSNVPAQPPAGVPLPPQHRPSSQQQQQSQVSRTPASMGPMSSSVVIPARPKPGRKPLEHAEAQDRRRVQNRLAQRSFRDKRQQKLHDCQLENAQLKQDKEDLLSERERMLEEHRLERQHMQSEIARWKQRAADAEHRVSVVEWKIQNAGQMMDQSAFSSATARPLQHTTSTAPSRTSALDVRTHFGYGMPSYGASSVPTPPEDSFSANETDYTAAWSRQSASNRRPISTQSDDSQHWNMTGMDLDTTTGDDKCGFCTDDGNCACKQDKMVECAPVPGTCELCQRDPARAQACRDIAAQAQATAQMSSSDGPRVFDASAGGMGSISMPPPPTFQRMSCSQLIDTFDRQLGTRVPSISELFPGNALHMYPPSGAGICGFDVDQQEAAQVLQSLSRRNTVVEHPGGQERGLVSGA